MVGRDRLVYTLFEAELDGPEYASDKAYADFCEAVALRIVRSRLFCADLLDISAFCLG